MVDKLRFNIPVIRLSSSPSLSHTANFRPLREIERVIFWQTCVLVSFFIHSSCYIQEYGIKYSNRRQWRATYRSLEVKPQFSLVSDTRYLFRGGSYPSTGGTLTVRANKWRILKRSLREMHTYINSDNFKISWLYKKMVDIEINVFLGDARFCQNGAPVNRSMRWWKQRKKWSNISIIISFV